MSVRKCLGKVPPRFLEIPLKDSSFPLPRPSFPFSFSLPLSLLPNPLLFLSLLFQLSGFCGERCPQLCPHFLKQRRLICWTQNIRKMPEHLCTLLPPRGSRCFIPRNLSKGEGPTAQEAPSSLKTPQAAANQLVGKGDVVTLEQEGLQLPTKAGFYCKGTACAQKAVARYSHTPRFYHVSSRGQGCLFLSVSMRTSTRKCARTSTQAQYRSQH